MHSDFKVRTLYIPNIEHFQWAIKAMDQMPTTSFIVAAILIQTTQFSSNIRKTASGN